MLRPAEQYEPPVKYQYPADLGNHRELQPAVSKQTVIAKPEEGNDWLLDPVNLYMRGMAQRREQMKKL